MTKVLKPYTIIPDDLYVRRDADRQLEESIEDMGRPPYVLVARQMGKTNLLLRAKRALPKDGDVFVYIDMSNPFTSSRECLRNIIDRVLETSDQVMEAASYTIAKNRELSLPPHTEHGRELRTCLRNISGKLVIILDEIDALTRSSFSDEIFSQIRSVYFERVNFEEFNRLTYVLSGVAEPTEIIKNPKISPFNIGQKIFLNDFSYEEYQHFILKAGLSISSEITDHVFEWTKGNPRMTWDVCSAIEEKISDGKQLTTLDVDQIINELYLTYYDRAPVDHIRDLAANDTSIRNAIIEIQYNKGDTLSDTIRRKLYLSGIISSMSLDGNAVLKNKIIDKSLSIKWLNEINVETKDYYIQGNNAFDATDFYDAYINYSQYLAKEPKDVPSLFYYRFAISCFRLNKYSDALKYLAEFEFNPKEFEDNYLLTVNIKGLCYAYLGKSEDARACFSEVIAASKKNYQYFDSKINLISFDSITATDEDLIKVKADAIETLEEIESFKDNYLEKQYLEMQFSLKIVLGNIYKKLLNTTDALAFYNQALEDAPIYVHPEILYQIYQLDSSYDVKNLVDLIINNQLKPHQFDPLEPFKLTTSILYKVAVLVYKLNQFNFDRLSNYIINELSSNESLNTLKYYLASYINKYLVEDRHIAINLLEEIYKERETIDDPKFNFKILKSLALNHVKPSSYDTTYFNTLRNHRDIVEFDAEDMQVFAKNILSLQEKDLSRRALEIVELGLSFSDNKDSKNWVFNLLFYYYKVIGYRLLNNKSELFKWGNKLLQLLNRDNVIEEPSEHPKASISERELSIIKQEAIRAVNNGRTMSLNSSRKFGRNDIVTVVYGEYDQRIGKYKKFEDDIERGKCRVVI